MSTPSTQLDRVALVESQTLGIVRHLLVELGSRSTVETLDRAGLASQLEHDLGLGSLERVELLVRLDAAFSVRLPDSALVQAETVADLVSAVTAGQAAGGSSVAQATVSSASAPASSVSPSTRRVGQFLEGAESLTEIVVARGRAEPDLAHIQLYEEEDRIRTITCGELFERASAVGAELTRRGLRPGEAVALMLPTGAEFFFCFAGIWMAGGIPVPMYPPFRADRIEEYAARQEGILRNAEAKFLITFQQVAGLARLLAPRVPSLIDLLDASQLVKAKAPPLPPKTEARPTDYNSYRGRGNEIAFLQYTSGSTGDPKGVVLTHANLLANIRSIGEAVQLVTEDVVVSWLPLYHDMGLIGAWFAPLCFGLPLAVMSPLAFLTRPERWLKAIHRHGATISPAPNFAYELCTRKIADRDIEGLDLSTWRAALNGAEQVRSETLDRFAARFAPYGFRRAALAPVYGLAEASLCVSAPQVGSGHTVDRIARDAFEQEGRAVSTAANDATTLEFVGAGRAIPGMDVQIVDREGHAVGDRVEGRLSFRSASATQGYYHNPEATQGLILKDGWLDSGDLAYVVESEIFITGRAKDIIIKGGRNLYPHKVEEVAGSVAGVRTGCVVAFGAPDAQSGTERFIVAAEMRNAADRERIAADITRQVTEAIGVPPDRVELLAPHSIPKTSSGKLRRSETRRLFLAGELGRHKPVWMQLARLSFYSMPRRLGVALRHGVKAAAEFVYGVYALCAFSVLLVPLWIVVRLAPNRRAAASATRVGARMMLRCAGIGVSVKGADLLKDLKSSGPWIFAPNHSSYLDILTTVAVMPAGVLIVAKGETGSMPLISTFIRRIGHLTFDRSDSQARVRQTDDVAKILERGESVVIFPEGTFTSAPGIRPFQLGAFKSAVETNRPICPVALKGARQILRDKTFLPKFGRVEITLGPLVQPKTVTSAKAEDADWHEIVRLRDAVRGIVAQNTGEPLL
jgi:1-acyl-sn-glycerol-3-phosphate acyltransferase